MNPREMAFVDAFIAPTARENAVRALKRRTVDRKARSKFHRWLADQIVMEPAFATDCNRA